MSTLEVQGLHHKSMKKRECEVSKPIESVAQESCSQALHEEVAATLEKYVPIRTEKEAVLPKGI